MFRREGEVFRLGTAMEGLDCLGGPGGVKNDGGGRQGKLASAD
jgi:hypothetical protein